MDNFNITQPNPEIVILLDELNKYQRSRKLLYGEIADQLDMLFKDINSGIFGESAKQGLFYNHISQIKQSIEKPDTDDIRQRLDSLIASDNQQGS
jgi:hypothetical protein